MRLFIELYGENISSETTKTICDRLQREKIQALCLRECTITDKDYKKILKRVGTSYTIRHLSLCVEVVVDSFRVQTVANTIQENLSLSGLFLHGSTVGDSGMHVLQLRLLRHPGIVTLDLSDCQLGDEGVGHICQLLPGDSTRHGLRELVLSSNSDITPIGWNKLSLALASGNHLVTFCIDYNDIGDGAAACILTAVAGSTTLETLDMECTELTEVTGTLFLQLLNKSQMSLKNVNLEENDISSVTMETIRLRIHGTDLPLEQNIDVPSDDDRSLATSEPPLDDTNSLLGYGKNSRRNSAFVVEEPEPTYTDDVVDIEHGITVKNNHLAPLGDKTKLSRSASVFDDMDGPWVETGALRSHSMINIRSKEDSGRLDHGIKAAEGYTRIEVTGQTNGEHNSNIRHRRKSSEFRSNNLLIPETPSLVSLHTYGNDHGGQQDDDFQPLDTLFTRPTSAPTANHNRLTVQGIGSSGFNSQPRPATGSSNGVLTAEISPLDLAQAANQRRYSTGNALFVSGTETGSVNTSLRSVSVVGMSDSARASLTSASVRNISEMEDNLSNEGDLDLEEL